MLVELNQQHELFITSTKESMLSDFKKKSDQASESIASVEVRHKQDLVDAELRIESKYKQLMDAEASLAEAKLSKELENQRAKLESEFEKRLNLSRDEVASMVSGDVENKYKLLLNEAIAKRDADLIAASAKALENEKQWKLEKDKMQKEFNKQLSKTVQEIEKIHGAAIKSLQATLRAKEEEYAANLEKLQGDNHDQLKSTVGTYKSKYEKLYKAKLQQQEEKHAEALAQLQSALQDTHSRLQEELQNALMSQENKLTMEFSKERTELKNIQFQLERKHVDDLEAQEVIFEKKLQSSLSSLRETLTQEFNMKMTIAEQKSSELRRSSLELLEESLKCEHANHVNKVIVEQRELQKAALDTMKQSYEIEMEKAVQTAVSQAQLSDKSNEDLRESLMVEKLRKEYELRSAKQVAIALTDAEINWKKTQQMSTDNIVEKLNKEWQMKINETNEKWTMLMTQNSDNKCNALRAEMLLEMEYALDSQKLELQKQYQVEIMELNSQMTQLKEMHERQLADLTVNSAIRTQSTVNEVINKVGSEKDYEHKAALLNLASAHNAQLAAVRHEMEQVLSNAMEQKASELKNIEASIENLKIQHNLRIEEILTEQKSLRHAESLSARNQFELQLKELSGLHEIEIQKLSNEHQSTLQQMKQAFDITCANLRKELTTSHAKALSMEEIISGLKRDREDDLKQMAASNDKNVTATIDEKNKQHKQAVLALTDQHSMEIQRMIVVQEKAEARHTAQLAQLDLQYKANYARLESEYNSKLANERAQLEQASKSQAHQAQDTYNADLSRLQREKDYMEQKLLQALEAKKLEVEESYETIKSLQEVIEKNRADAFVHLTNEAKQVENKYLKMLNDQENSYELKLNKLTAARDKMLNQHEEAMDLLKSTHAIELEATFRKLTNEFHEKLQDESRIASLKQEAREKVHREAIERLRSECTQSESTYRAKLEDVQNHIALLNDQHNAQIKSIYDKHNLLLQKRMDDTNAENNAKDKQHMNELQAIRREYELLLTNKEQEHVLEYSKIKQQMKESIEASSSEVEHLNMQHGAEVSKLQDAIIHQKQYQTTKDNLHHAEIDMILDTKKQELERLHAQYQENMSHQLDLVTKQLLKEKDIALYDLRETLTNQFQSEINQLKSESNNSSLRDSAKIQALNDQLRKASEDHQSAVTSLTNNHAAELSKLLSDHESKISQWKAMNYQLECSVQQSNLVQQEISNDIKQIQMQHLNHISDINRNHENQLNMIANSHADTVNAMKQDWEGKRSAWQVAEHTFNQTIATLNSTIKSKESELMNSSNANIALTSTNNHLNNTIAKMNGELSQLAKEMMQLNEHQQAKEREYNTVIMPDVIRKEKLATEMPLRTQIKEMELLHAQQKSELELELSNKVNAVSQLEAMLEELRREMKQMEDDFKRELTKSLAQQHDDLQSGYLNIIQQQVEALMSVIIENTEKNTLGNLKKGFNNSTIAPKSKYNNGVEDMYQHFLDVINVLPEKWQEKYGTFPPTLNSEHQDSVNGGKLVNPAFESIRFQLDHLKASRVQNSTAQEKSIRTPIKVLVKAEEHRDQWILEQQAHHKDFVQRNGNLSARSDNSKGPMMKENIRVTNKNPATPTAPSRTSTADSVSTEYDNKTGAQGGNTKRTSPTDQIVSAVLDGDTEGIKAVVKSYGGGNLQSAFWKPISKAVLLLHRAVSGLHFHGSEVCN